MGNAAMNLSGLFKRDRNLRSAFAALDADMGEMLQSAFKGRSPDNADDLSGEAVAVPLDEVDAPPLSPEHAEPGLTAYAQERLSALSSFQTMYQETGEELEALGKAFSNMNAVHHLTREFLASTRSTIHRVNDLEIANTRLQADNNRLRRHAELVGRLKAQHEALVESTRRRDAKGQQELEKYRQSLADARSEAVEARNAISALETERGDLMNALATRSSEAERLARENEVLRERHVNQSADLDQVSKRAAEIQRRYDELVAVHQADVNNLSETRTKLALAEGELVRLQKQTDKLQLDLSEAGGSVRSLERDLDEAAARHAAELQVAGNESETLKAKIGVLSASQSEAAAEIAALKHRIKDAETEMRIAETRARQLRQEAEAGQPAADAAAIRAELDRLKADRAALEAQVKRLAGYERFYRSVKNRQCDQAREEATGIEKVAKPSKPAEPGIKAETAAADEAPKAILHS